MGVKKTGIKYIFIIVIVIILVISQIPTYGLLLPFERYGQAHLDGEDITENYEITSWS